MRFGGMGRIKLDGMWRRFIDGTRVVSSFVWICVFTRGRIAYVVVEMVAKSCTFTRHSIDFLDQRKCR